MPTHMYFLEVTPTGIIAVATVVYVVATILLWRSTEKTAQAAKKSADMAASLHRPYIGVAKFEHTTAEAVRWWLMWEIKNFGTLSTADVTVEMTILAGDDPRWNLPPSPPVEVFPSASIHDGHEIQMDRGLCESIFRGDTRLAARIQVHYPAPGHGRYRHTVMAVYHHDRQNFRLEHSRTEHIAS